MQYPSIIFKIELARLGKENKSVNIENNIS